MGELLKGFEKLKPTDCLSAEAKQAYNKALSYYNALRPLWNKMIAALNDHKDVFSSALDTLLLDLVELAFDLYPATAAVNSIAKVLTSLPHERGLSAFLQFAPVLSDLSFGLKHCYDLASSYSLSDIIILAGGIFSDMSSIVVTIKENLYALQRIGFGNLGSISDVQTSFRFHRYSKIASCLSIFFDLASTINDITKTIDATSKSNERFNATLKAFLKAKDKTIQAIADYEALKGLPFKAKTLDDSAITCLGHPISLNVLANDTGPDCGSKKLFVASYTSDDGIIVSNDGNIYWSTTKAGTYTLTYFAAYTDDKGDTITVGNSMVTIVVNDGDCGDEPDPCKDPAGYKAWFKCCIGGDITPICGTQDPNSINGPTGTGEENWINADQTLTYTIHYENDPELANAPVQFVRVEQTLDASVDIRSFRLGVFGFGSIVIDAAVGLSSYQTPARSPRGTRHLR